MPQIYPHKDTAIGGHKRSDKSLDFDQGVNRDTAWKRYRVKPQKDFCKEI